MNKNKRYINQLFAAPENTITSTDLEPAISIDHNQRLVEGIQSLQTVLGITEMTPMAAGTQVKQYKYTKENTPDQVAEGETINLTKYNRKLVNTFELVLNKYRKRTTAEAIQKVGRDKAINDTDTLLEREVQKEIKAKFYTTILAGTGKATPKAATIQAAIAAVWGQLSTYFADYDVTPVYFVNPLDIADYLATAQVTLQTAFGFKYIEDFLGMGTTIIDQKVTKGNVVGTVTQNLNGVYIPAGGDVGTTFGLTSDTTGLVSMKHSLADDALSIDTIMASGVTFYAEDASGIFICPTTTSAGA